MANRDRDCVVAATFALRPVGEEQTRLVNRVRFRMPLGLRADIRDRVESWGPSGRAAPLV